MHNVHILHIRVTFLNNYFVLDCILLIYLQLNSEKLVSWIFLKDCGLPLCKNLQAVQKLTKLYYLLFK